ncbi:hypothetical protein HZS61_011586 [Fusarium oxysporum f. sp. conglutinans]|uniref:Uncharacterized protein n=1 Tax=Fusarium oxysporum f. sp. conglutinans TaxID=100902 RepID=A0A8H6GYL3_FUSOX|nr:hypothetical protein HZS61_011586 [Fusarium oxysporum f. sp. conglutinans]
MFPPNDEVELHTVKPSARPYSRKSLVASQTQERSALIQQTSWKHGNPRQSEPHSESQGYEKYSASYSRLQRSSVSPNGCHERAEPTLEATPSLTELLKEKLCFRSLHKKENPKKVCSNNRLSALGHFSLFHLPAITITLLLLVLYVRHFRWTPPHPTGDELSKHSSGTRKWKQPLVAVHCNETWVTGKTATFNFDTGFLDNTTLELDLESDSRLKNMAEDTDLGVQDAMFIDLENKIIRHSVSAAILFANRVRKDGIQEKRDTNGETILGLGLCLVSARWVDAEVWVIRQNSVVVNSNLGFTSEDFLTYLHETSTAKDVIKMSDGWLKGVGPLLNGTQESPSTSIYDGASVFCSHSAIGFFSGCLANALAVHLTDALAQPTRLRAWYDDGSGDPLPDEQDTIIQSTHYKYTYAYELKGSIAIPLALAVLLLHVCTALVHVGTILLSPRPWHGSSWRSFGQMLVLALRSRVDGLDNVGGGVSSPQTWKRTTMVRDVGEGRLEMIVNVDEGEVQGDGEEQIIVQFILDLNSRCFPSRLRGVEEMANRLLTDSDALSVGKFWASTFIKRERCDSAFVG